MSDPYIDPGAKQSSGPKPPECIGPLAHIRPSELTSDIKKGYDHDFEGWVIVP